MGGGVRWRAIVAVLTAVGCLVPGMVSASTASAAARSSPRLELQVVLDEPSPPSVYEDNVTHLSGQLSNGAADKLIVIRRLVGGSWQKVGSTRTVANGAFTFDLTPVDPGVESLQAAHPTHAGYIQSPTRTLHVLDRRVYLFSHPTYETLTTIVMSGSTRPVGAGRRIVIQRLIGGTWVAVGSGYTDAKGDYAIHMPNDLPGAWTVRAYWAGSHPDGGTAEYSGVHHYTVKAVLHPVVTPVTRDQLGGSYHDGCPVGPASLRNVTLTFKTFGPPVDRGTLVVRDSIVSRVISVWSDALAHGYPIRRIFPTAHYGGSDIKSMYHDNTSAFNCRHVTGDPTHLSPHAYGVAIDINTVENPYQDVHGTWWPKTIGQKYRNRSHAYPGMLYDSSRVTQGLKSRGFRWGGDWSHPDYQHFDTFSNKRAREPSARAAGPLTARSMPAASAFGIGWSRYADPGSPEAGWTGNGTFVHARGGTEAANGVLPLGCAHRSRLTLPMPQFALEGAYLSAAGRPGQAVVLQFHSDTAAGNYFAGLEQVLRTCVRPDGPAGVSVQTTSATGTSYTGERTYAGAERWREHDVRSGSRVTVLLARGR